MNWTTLIEKNFAAILGIMGILVGVVLGFSLNTVWEAWKERRKRKQMRNQIPAELETNLLMIEQKRDILNQIIIHLENQEVLTGISVRFITTFYDTHIQQLYPYYSAKERHSLHFIYQSLKAIDSVMHTFEQELMQHLALGFVKDPFEHYASRMKELLQRVNLTEDLLRQHLAGEPVDVLHIEGRQLIS